MVSGPAPGWYRDPSGRFEHRYWDGRTWTEHAATAGVTYRDPPRPGPPVAAGPFPAAGATAPAGAPPDATLGQRFGSFLLELTLLVVTLGIGWLVWAGVTFGRAQSPAKAILGQRVVKQDTGQAASWADMFLRTVVVQLGLLLVSIATFGIPLLIGGGMVLAGERRQAAWDRLAGTLVVVDREGVTLPRTGPVRY